MKIFVSVQCYFCLKAARKEIDSGVKMTRLYKNIWQFNDSGNNITLFLNYLIVLGFVIFALNQFDAS